MSAEIVRHENGIIVLRIPLKLRRRGGRREIVLPANVRREEDSSALQIAVVRAYHWQNMLESGEAASISELANKFNLNKSNVSGFLRANLLAPDIIAAILAENEPNGLSITRLREG